MKFTPFFATLGAAAALWSSAALAQTAPDTGKPAEGIGFLALTDLGVVSALELSGATVCLTTGSAAITSVPTYFSANSMDLSQVIYDSAAEALGGYAAGECDVIADDVATLEAHQAQLANAGAHIVLPETIQTAEDPK